MIILDSDILIDLLRKYPPAVNWYNQLEEDIVVLPGFVVLELLKGCQNKRQQKRMEKTIDPFEIMWPSHDACDKALEIFAQYHLSHGIGMIDVLIGHTAVSLNIPLYTFNRKHYEPIPDLIIIEPYERT